MLRATDDTVVITIRGIGEMTARNPDSFIDLSALKPISVARKPSFTLGNAKATPPDFPAAPQTQN